VSKSIFTAEYDLLRLLLKELRTQKGLTQAQLSGALGLPQSFVSKYETGERRLDVIEARVVCEALGTTLSSTVRKYESRLAALKQGDAS